MPAQPKAVRFTFRKRERLCQKRAFEYLFEHGASFRSGVLKFFYVYNLPDELVQAPFSVAFAAPKRNFKRAIHRNLLKRRMREAVRLNKHLVIPYLEDSHQNLAILIKYQSRQIADSDRIHQALIRGFQKLPQLSPKKSDQ